MLCQVGKRLLIAAMLAQAGYWAGCAQPAANSTARTAWPWDAKKPETARPSIPTPRERIEAFQDMAKRAGKMTPAEQETLSAKLANAYKTEDDAIIRAQVLRTTAMMTTSTATETLSAGLQDADADVRAICCQAWGERGGPEAAAALGRVLASDPNIHVRLAAARGLAECDDAASVQALGQALEDPDPAMQYRAVQSLKQSTGKNFGDDVNAWREFVNGGGIEANPLTVADRMRKLVY